MRSTPPLCSRSSRPASAFTLVELMVVIGIIAVLIAVLLPAQSKARDRAKTNRCMSSLHQIGLAAVMYTNDTNGFLVPRGYAGNAESWATILVNWHQLKLPGFKSPAEAAGAGPNISSVIYRPNRQPEYNLIPPSPTSANDPAGAAIALLYHNAAFMRSFSARLQVARDSVAPPSG